MRFLYLILGACFCAGSCYGQTSADDALFLKETRSKYDAPFDRNLDGVSCAVDFDWKQHFAENKRRGNEGTDEEIATFVQPIRNRVTIGRIRDRVPTKNGDAVRVTLVISSEGTGGKSEMPPYLDETAKRLRANVLSSLEGWFDARTIKFLPQEYESLRVEPSISGYKLLTTASGDKGSVTFERLLTRDMNVRLQTETRDGKAWRSSETDFRPGPKGFLLAALRTDENEDPKFGNRIAVNYTYQSVDGFQLPEQVTWSLESQHEVWRYRLADCKVQAAE